jgi:hypothetical protein
VRPEKFWHFDTYVGVKVQLCTCVFYTVQLVEVRPEM